MGPRGYVIFLGGLMGLAGYTIMYQGLLMLHGVSGPARPAGPGMLDLVLPSRLASTRAKLAVPPPQGGSDVAPPVTPGPGQQKVAPGPMPAPQGGNQSPGTVLA